MGNMQSYGRGACLAAALAFATPSVAQTVPAPQIGQASTVSDPVPIAGMDIPDSEASELRGGMWAVVSYKVGRNIGYKIYSCATSASCKAKGAQIVKDIGGAVLVQIAADLLLKAACSRVKIRC